MSEHYQPSGVEFYDAASGRTMMFVDDAEPQKGWRGWLLYKHPDGQWVSLRKATLADLLMLAQAGVDV